MSAIITPVHQKRLRPVSKRDETFERAYRHLLPPSDFDCVARLIKARRIDVVLDADTHAIVLVPSPEVEHFLDEIFKALVNE